MSPIVILVSFDGPIGGREPCVGWRAALREARARLRDGCTVTVRARGGEDSSLRFRPRGGACGSCGGNVKNGQCVRCGRDGGEW